MNTEMINGNTNIYIHIQQKKYSDGRIAWGIFNEHGELVEGTMKYPNHTFTPNSLTPNYDYIHCAYDEGIFKNNKLYEGVHHPKKEKKEYPDGRIAYGKFNEHGEFVEGIMEYPNMWLTTNNLTPQNSLTPNYSYHYCAYDEGIFENDKLVKGVQYPSSGSILSKTGTFCDGNLIQGECSYCPNINKSDDMCEISTKKGEWKDNKLVRGTIYYLFDKIPKKTFDSLSFVGSCKNENIKECECEDERIVKIIFKNGSCVEESYDFK